MRPSHPAPAARLLVGLAALYAGGVLGCGAGTPDATSATATGSSSTGPSTSTGDPSTGSSASATNGATTESTAATTADATTSSQTTRGFIDDGDVPDPNACHFWLQDCPPGMKCALTFGEGSTCVPVAPDPDPVGAPCHGPGPPVVGDDSCEAGSVCWSIDPVTMIGQCLAVCYFGVDACPQPDQTCIVVADGSGVDLCFQSCDPLDPACLPDLSCDLYPGLDEVICDTPAPGKGLFGEYCSYGACASGLTCVSFYDVPCDHEACCTAFCDLDDPGFCEALDPAIECVAVYSPGRAPPGLEHVGLCRLPE